MSSFVSTSASLGVARGFANSGTSLGDSKTIFHIQNSQKSKKEGFACVDVEWISPYPSEQEIIMKISGTAILDPTRLFSQSQQCECKEWPCRHIIEKYSNKNVIIDLLNPDFLDGEKKLIYSSILKEELLNFLRRLEEGLNFENGVKFSSRCFQGNTTFARKEKIPV